MRSIMFNCSFDLNRKSFPKGTLQNKFIYKICKNGRAEKLKDSQGQEPGPSGFFNLLLSPFNSHLTAGSQNGQGEMALSSPGLPLKENADTQTHRHTRVHTHRMNDTD